MNFMNLINSMKQKKKVIALFFFLLLVCFLGIFIQSDSKIDLAAQQLNILTDNIRNYYKAKPNAWGLNSYFALKNGIVPQEMMHGRQIYNNLNKEVIIGADLLGNTVMPGSRTFAIVYKNLSFEQCVDLSTFPFSQKLSLSFEKIDIINTQNNEFSWGNSNSLPISKDKAKEVCKDKNDILWNIYL